MLGNFSGFMRCSCLSAVEASSSWKGVSPWNRWTETCNRFVAEGRAEICFGFAGAERQHSDGKKEAERHVFYLAGSTSPHH